VHVREGFGVEKRVSTQKHACGTKLLIWEVNYTKLLEMVSFYPLYIILGVGKQRDLENEKYQTVGGALRKDRKLR